MIVMGATLIIRLKFWS